MELSVVVPVRNEAGNIVPLIGEIHAALADAWSYEIIYVDDGSTDGSDQEVARATRVPGRPLRLIRHEHGAGQSAALRTGIRAARGSWIVTLDGDGQNDPADIPRLLQAANVRDSCPAFLLVIGQRGKRRDTLVRRVSSRIANGLRARLLRDATPDTGAGLKIFPRDLYLRLPYFDHMHRFLPALVQREGGRVLSIPVSHRARARGRSKYGIGNRLWVGIVDLFGMVWLQRRRYRPGSVTEERIDGS